MAKLKQFLKTPAATAGIFLLAAVLLLTSAVGGARAALTYFSEDLRSEVELDSIAVQLLENGNAVSGSGAILKDFLGTDTELIPGKTYSEELSVKNTGEIDQFVRVTVYKYWGDKDGNKRTDLDASYITLGLVTDGGWTADSDSATEERTVLYYGTALEAGEESSLFLESVTIDGQIGKIVDQVYESTEDGLTTVTTTYVYDGAYFYLSAMVDAVQTHSGQDAIRSAWGQKVTVSGSTLTLG